MAVVAPVPAWRLDGGAEGPAAHESAVPARRTAGLTRILTYFGCVGVVRGFVAVEGVRAFGGLRVVAALCDAEDFGRCADVDEVVGAVPLGGGVEVAALGLGALEDAADVGWGRPVDLTGVTLTVVFAGVTLISDVLVVFPLFAVGAVAWLVVAWSAATARPAVSTTTLHTNPVTA